MTNVLVTGGAGFIGSHLVEKLLENKYNVIAVDNLSTGELKNLSGCRKNENFEFINSDIKDKKIQKVLENIDIVFHLAADPEVRTGFTNPGSSFNQNIKKTFQLLEFIRKSNVKKIGFTSTSTVYGEPEAYPTEENYGPMLPISHYGASKLSCEALISAYCNNYGIKGQIYRLANIVGPRSNHGILWDFKNKLSNNGEVLEVLGDGTQSKSYLHVKDCVDSFLYCIENINSEIEAINIGNQDKTDVLTIAKIMIEKMNLKDTKIQVTGGVDSGRGWIGDVKKMNLSIKKLKKFGWQPKINSREAIEKTVDELI